METNNGSVLQHIIDEDKLNDGLEENIFNLVIENLPANLVTPEVGSFVFKAIQLMILYAKKNHDYGNSFNIAYKKFGKIYPLTRLHDKYGRLENLCRIDEQYVNDESIEDTLDDLACYSIMFSNALKLCQEKNQ